MGTMALSPQLNSWDVNLTVRVYLVPRWMRGTHLHTPYSFMAWWWIKHRNQFVFTILPWPLLFSSYRFVVVVLSELPWRCNNHLFPIYWKWHFVDVCSHFFQLEGREESALQFLNLRTAELAAAIRNL